MKFFRLSLPAVLAMAAAFGQTPVITSVSNAASNIAQGLPNSGIAQGSIFIVKGTNLGPGTLTFATTPFQSSDLDGTSISIAIGSTTVNALMYYASAGQLAALLPSGAPAGAGSMTVTYSGSASATFAVQVVQNNIGVFSVSEDGQGVAIATYADYSLVSAVPGNGTFADTCTAAGQACPYTYKGAAEPGDTITLWATGLGAVSGGDGASSLGQTNSVAMTLYIGGVSVPITYQGRSGCCIGEDQIIFTMPNNVGQAGGIPTGCAVPVILQIGSLVSNSTVMPVSASSRSCTPQSPALNSSAVQTLTNASGPLIFGSAELGRQLFSVSSNGAFYEDFAQISFGQVSVSYNNQPTQAQVISSLDSPPPGTCVAYNSASSGNTALLTYQGGASAGNMTITSAAGPVSLASHGGTPTVYGAVLSGFGNYFSTGTYTISATGGNPIQAFSTKFTIVQTPTWGGPDQNRLITAGVTRANGMTMNWTGGSATYNVLITGTSYTDSTAATGASFACLVPSSLETFTVPPLTLLALPSGPYTEVDFKPVLPSQSFTANGLDVGVLNFNYQTSVFPQFN